MKKGLTLTLMTVVIALMSAQAMAMAPVISDLPDPVIGTQGFTTDANKYVYPDAVNLNDYVVDDNVADANLRWSYMSSSSKYTFNGKGQVAGDPTSPADAETINQSVAGGETNPDGLANTVTIRDQALNPLGGALNDTGVADGPSAGTLVTLFCSDGTSYSSANMWLYTDKGGQDRYSPAVIQKDQDYTTGHGTWSIYGGSAFLTGSCTTATLAGAGMCLTTTLNSSQANTGTWVTPFGFIEMKARTVYRIRLKMIASMTSPIATPFYDFVIDQTNTGEAGAFKGKGAFFFDLFRYTPVLEGGANGYSPSTPGGEVEEVIYWAPTAVGTTRWTNNFYTVANDSQNDARLMFRVLDLDNHAQAAALGFRQQGGSLCIKHLTLEELPLDSMALDSSNGAAEVYAANSLTRTIGTVAGNVQVQAYLYSNLVTVTFSGGVATIQPTSTSRSVEIIDVYPSTSFVADPTAPPYNVAQWPINWESNVVYQMVAGLSAPDANSSNFPMDVIYLIMMSPTYELYAENCTLGAAINSADPSGMPTTGTAQEFMTFVNSMKETLSATESNGQLRWVIRLLNNPSTVLPSGQSLNAGGVNVHSVKVRKVKW